MVSEFAPRFVRGGIKIVLSRLNACVRSKKECLDSTSTLGGCCPRRGVRALRSMRDLPVSGVSRTTKGLDSGHGEATTLRNTDAKIKKVFALAVSVPLLLNVRLGALRSVTVYCNFSPTSGGREVFVMGVLRFISDSVMKGGTVLRRLSVFNSGRTKTGERIISRLRK